MKPEYPVLLVAGLGGLFTVVNLACAQDWTLTGAPLVAGVFDPGWKAVACSADGTKLVAAGWYQCPISCFYTASPIYISADSGMTWTQTSSPTNRWSSVASLADGVKLVAATTYDNSSNFNPGLIYTSADGGATWAPTAAPSSYWTRVASSADGTRLVALAGNDTAFGSYPGLIYTSSDSAATWTPTTVPDNEWTSIALSADGTKLVAAASPQFSGGFIFTSTNFGATWRQTSAPSNSWSWVASSADGVKLVAAARATYPNNAYVGNGIYTSTNSGATWKQTSAPPNNWVSVASSADGTILVAASLGDGGDGLIYISTDSGGNWMAMSSPQQDFGVFPVASSADGRLFVAAARGIYTSAPPVPSPRVRINPSGAGFDIAWLVPATRFVLQENVDLTTTNWTDVLTPPTLNYMNLHYEVSVTPAPGRHFYRLKQQ